LALRPPGEKQWEEGALSMSGPLVVIPWEGRRRRRRRRRKKRIVSA
jgi:hypothetical protein